MDFDPGSLHRATGEKVTVSEVIPVFRGTDNRQSVLGSWGPSAAREGRPKGDITLLTSAVIEDRALSLEVQVFEIVFESRGKLIGGSLSRG